MWHYYIGSIFYLIPVRVSVEGTNFYLALPLVWVVSLYLFISLYLSLHLSLYVMMHHINSPSLSHHLPSGFKSPSVWRADIPLKLLSQGCQTPPRASKNIGSLGPRWIHRHHNHNFSKVIILSPRFANKGCESFLDCNVGHQARHWFGDHRAVDPFPSLVGILYWF